MSDSLVVLLGDTVAGTLSRLAGGRLRFDYDPDYQERPAATPLSLSIPVQVGAHPDRVVAPWLWGLLPDNAAVPRRWAREFQASASSPFSLLATPIGEDCAGAVRFVSPDNLEGALEPRLDGLARRVVHRPVQSRRHPGQDRTRCSCRVTRSAWPRSTTSPRRSPTARTNAGCASQ